MMMIRTHGFNNKSTELAKKKKDLNKGRDTLEI